jgi:hypothetical protein
VLFGGAEIVVVAIATAAGRQVLAGPLLRSARQRGDSGW